VRFAHRQEFHDQRLAGLQFDGNFSFTTA